MEYEDYRLIRGVFSDDELNARDGRSYHRLRDGIANSVLGEKFLLFAPVFKALELAPIRISSVGTENLISKLKEKPDTDTFRNYFTMCFVAGAIVELQETSAVNVDRLIEQIRADQKQIVIELSSYSAYRAFDATISESSKALERLKEIDTLFEAAREKMGGYYETCDKTIGEAKSRLSRLIEEAAQKLGAVTEDTQRISSILTELDKRTATTEENLESFREAVSVRMHLNIGADYWEDRAKSAKWGFIVSTGLLVLIFVGVPALGFYFVNEIQHFLNKQITSLLKEACPNVAAGMNCEPGAMTMALASFNRLAIVGIPLLLFFWLIKLLVRYNLHALVMGNDARQRSTMINSFVQLADKGVVKLEDKTELLTAIFRPPPGTSGETIEVPNVTAVIDRIK